MKNYLIASFVFSSLVFAFTNCKTYRNLDTALANPLDVKSMNLSRQGLV